MLKRIEVFYLLSVKLLQTIIIERLRFKEIFWTQRTHRLYIATEYDNYEPPYIKNL